MYIAMNSIVLFAFVFNQHGMLHALQVQAVGDPWVLFSTCVDLLLDLALVKVTSCSS